MGDKGGKKDKDKARSKRTASARRKASRRSLSRIGWTRFAGLWSQRSAGDLRGVPSFLRLTFCGAVASIRICAVTVRDTSRSYAHSSFATFARGSAGCGCRIRYPRWHRSFRASQPRIEFVLHQLQAGSAELHFEQETATCNILPTKRNAATARLISITLAGYFGGVLELVDVASAGFRRAVSRLSHSRKRDSMCWRPHPRRFASWFRRHRIVPRSGALPSDRARRRPGRCDVEGST